MCLAVPGKIIKIDGDKKAVIDFDGATGFAQLDLVPQAKKGDYVIVHAGFAIKVLAEQDAKETLQLLKEAYK